MAKHVQRVTALVKRGCFCQFGLKISWPLPLFKVSKFIHNKPSGFNDISESNQQDKYSLDTNNLASVFILNTITQVCPIGQCLQASQIIGRRRVRPRITLHVHGTVYERARHSVRTTTTGQTTHGPVCTLPAAATLQFGKQCIGSHSNWANL